MRVAFLVRRFPELSETFILNQVTGLLELGVDLEVLAWGPGDLSTVHPDVAKFGLMDRVRYLQLPPARLSRVARTARAVARGRAWRSPSVLRRSLDVGRYGRHASSLFLLHSAATVLSGPPYDIVHCQFGRLGLTALQLRHVGALQGRIVVAFRGSDLSRHRETKGYDALFREGDLFLPVCSAFRRQLVDRGCAPGRVRVHRSGIDLARFAFRARNRAPGEPLRVLTIARLVEKKGVEYGLRAVAGLSGDGHEVEYSIIGEGPLLKPLRQLAGELGLGPQVRFLGPRNHDEVVRFLERSHLLLAPSVTANSGDQEGIPNVLKEAMAMGLPVVSTHHSGIPELVEDGVSGFLAPERDAGALAHRMTALAEQPEQWGAIGRAGRSIVEADYDSGRLNRELVEVYRDLLRPSARD